MGIVLVALTGVGIYFGTHAIKTTHKGGGGTSPLLGKYKHAAVASDVTQCSQIGRYDKCSKHLKIVVGLSVLNLIQL